MSTLTAPRRGKYRAPTPRLITRAGNTARAALAKLAASGHFTREGLAVILVHGGRPWRCADCGGRSACKVTCRSFRYGYSRCPDCGSADSCGPKCPRLQALSI